MEYITLRCEGDEAIDIRRRGINEHPVEKQNRVFDYCHLHVCNFYVSIYGVEQSAEHNERDKGTNTSINIARR